MDLIPSFCARKHGKEEVTYPHPLMEAVLSETYGIMVYQEQVMQVAQRLGGYSLAVLTCCAARWVRKVRGNAAPPRHVRGRGGQERHSAGLANEIFDLMEKFAGYGFNKSHAAAYALLAYHTAWLKHHYTSEFFAGNMTIASDDTDKSRSSTTMPWATSASPSHRPM